MPHWNSNICGSCADDLRQEADAMQDQSQVADIDYQMNKEAYEDAQRENRLDRYR